MLPAVLTLAETKGMFAADTAVIKSATVPVPPIVAIPVLFVDCPAAVAAILKLSLNVNDVGVVVPVTSSAPVA